MNKIKELQKDNLHRLVTNKAFQFTNTFFPYTSGEIGPYYIQSASILKNGRDYMGACKDMEKIINMTIEDHEFDIISGGETRDWMFSFPLANTLQKSHAMLYKNGKILGANMKDKKVIHIADLNNEGSSPRDYWIPMIKQAGGEIKDIFFYVDRMEDGVNEIEKLGLDSHSLVPLDKTAWQILLDKDVITPEIYNNLNQRMENKEEWAINMLRSDKGLYDLASLLKDDKTYNKGIKIVRKYPEIKQELRERFSKTSMNLRI
jgi:orotate phosphoribosyltransferase